MNSVKKSADVFCKFRSPGLNLFLNGANQKGFTLLELLISVTMLTLIAVILFGAMRLASRSVESGEKKIEFLERSRASIRIIDSQIQSLLSLTYKEDDGTTKFKFTGESDAIQFPTNFSVMGRQRGFVLATYKVMPNASGKKTLYLSEEQIVGQTEEDADNANIPTTVKEDALKLLDGFDDISFKYFEKDLTEETGEWVEVWTDDNSLPSKIQVHLSRDKMESALIIPVMSGTLTLDQKQQQAATTPAGTSASTKPNPTGTPAKIPVGSRQGTR